MRRGSRFLIGLPFFPSCGKMGGTEKGGVFVAKELWQLLGLYLGAVNLAAFVLMGVDKRRAKKGQWRISEKALFLPVVLGGGLGGVLGMRTFHHKTKHWYFRFGFPLLLLLQLLLLGWLFWRARS